MRIPQFYGTASAEICAEDDGTRASIYVEVEDDGANGNWTPRTAHASLTIEAAAKLAEELDAVIDQIARNERARKEAKAARIAALKATLAELEAE